MHIDAHSAYANDENHGALLAGAEAQAAGLYRCLALTRLWEQSTSVSPLRHEEIVRDEKLVAQIYQATLDEIASAFGEEETAALRARIEIVWPFESSECPPVEQQRLF
jgi:hypothetical protein